MRLISTAPKQEQAGLRKFNRAAITIVRLLREVRTDKVLTLSLKNKLLDITESSVRINREKLLK